MSSGSEQTPFSLQEVVEFSTALRLALHDRALELGDSREIRHFHDADVVVNMILGFRQLEHQQVSLSSRPLLVRSLLASGYLGSAYLLRPHGLEVEEKMRTLQRVVSISARGRWQADVKAFLDGHGVRQELEDLAAALKATRSSEEQVAQFLSAMAQRGSTYFIAIELANGTWQQRLRRIWNAVVKLEPSGASMAETMNSPQCHTLRRALDETRPGRALPNLRDAAALASLHGLVVKARQGGYVPRFHTETAAIWRAARHEAVASLLRDGGPRSDTVLRSSSYYAVRASFSELRFPSPETATSDTVSLDRLRDISARLEDLVAKGTSDTEVNRILNETLEGRPLAEILRQYSSLALVGSIWKRAAIPPAVSTFVVDLPGILEVTQGESGGLLQELIDSEVHRIHNELETELSEMERWFAVHERLRRAAEELWARIPPSERGLPDPMRDMGLARWGASLGPDAQRRLESSVRMLVSDDAEERAAACAELSSLLLDCTTTDECVIACAIAWLLGLYELVPRTVDQFTTRRQREGEVVSSTALVLLRAAAQVRAGHLTSAQLEASIGALEERETKTFDGDRGMVSLTLGYLYYYAARRSRAPIRAASSREEQASLKRAARWEANALRAGERAVMALEPGSLAWAFAVNHCAYVAAVFDLDHRTQFQRIEELARLQSRSDLWNYRFADTLAYYQYLAAKRAWESLDAPQSGQVRTLRERLTEAKRLLDAARPNFGDPEISEHLTEVRFLQLELSSAYPDSVGVSEEQPR